ncbi:uncharacterized protein JCM6883_006382 [Sporobolomyces salmoneus]|uniref:uncharacterized protein n=1 Tax=Sporobolomyces salmoneus TaxID=183962 RepID=UPI00316E5B43
MSYGGAGGGYGQPQTRSKVVFVGNLPFDYTEEQFVEVFNSVGPVVSFRLVFDHGTGKPKGFGFCEYRDADTAASALRNLQGVEVGGRGLRLDFADTDDSPPSKRGGRPYGGGASGGGGGGYGGGGDRGYGSGGGQGYGHPPPVQQQQQQQHGAYGGMPPQAQAQNNGPPPSSSVQAIPPPPPPSQMQLPGGVQPRPLPPGIPSEPGKSSTDKITETIGTMAPGQLLDVMSQMKALVIASPYEARALLSANPQLSYALFQAMLCMGIVDPALLSKAFPSAFPSGSVPPPVTASPYGAPPPPSSASVYGAPPPSTAAYGTPPPPPPPGSAPYSYNRPQPVPPTSSYGAPPPAAAAPTPQAATAPPAMGATPDQAALIKQVLAMTDAQIASLDENSRNTILQIRQQAQRAMGM